MSLYRQTGRMPKQLADAPVLPVGLAPLWADFLHLHSRRGSNGFGPSLITDVEIDAWQRLRGVSLEAWQIDAICRADMAFINSRAEQA